MFFVHILNLLCFMFVKNIFLLVLDVEDFRKCNLYLYILLTYLNPLCCELERDLFLFIVYQK